MADNDGMNGDGAGDVGQKDPENDDPAPANGEDDEKSLTVGGQL